MIVSLNPEPNRETFQSLLDNTLIALEFESKNNQEAYLNHLGRKLENVVADIMIEIAQGTVFENSIELISGQKFPDIIANKYYGVEVKTTTQNHWTTTGNSVLEGTRVDNCERIFMLFGKMVSPIQFKCRPYEDCLSDVVVTHSPRYAINMELQKGQTIFDKLNIPYDTLRNSSNPVKPIMDYYRQFLKKGEEVWWLDQQNEAKAKSPIIKLWKNLPPSTKMDYLINAMVFFPKIFTNKSDKYISLGVWLINNYGVYKPNVRDEFSAGGKGIISWRGSTYTGIPRILINMSDSLCKIKSLLDNTNNEILSNYWEIESDDKILNWIDLVVENTNYMKLPFDLEEYLKDHLIV